MTYLNEALEDPSILLYIVSCYNGHVFINDFVKLRRVCPLYGFVAYVAYVQNIVVCII